MKPIKLIGLSYLGLTLALVTFTTNASANITIKLDDAHSNYTDASSLTQFLLVKNPNLVDTPEHVPPGVYFWTYSKPTTPAEWPDSAQWDFVHFSSSDKSLVIDCKGIFSPTLSGLMNSECTLQVSQSDSIPNSTQISQGKWPNSVRLVIVDQLKTDFCGNTITQQGAMADPSLYLFETQQTKMPTTTGQQKDSIFRIHCEGKIGVVPTLAIEAISP